MAVDVVAVPGVPVLVELAEEAVRVAEVVSIVRGPGARPLVGIRVVCPEEAA